MNTTFNLLFNSSKKIEFNPNWIKSSRYLSDAVEGIYAPSLQPGEVVSSIDAYKRHIVIIGTNGKDNIIIFELYCGNRPNGAIVSNETFNFHQLVKTVTGVDVSDRLKEVEILAIVETISKSLIRKVKSLNYTLSPWEIA